MAYANRFRADSVLIFAVALVLFVVGIWDEQPQGFDGRWALFLNEMFRHGPSLFPTTYGQPYPDYPGTATFFSYIVAKLVGAPNHLANVLPTALASAGVLAVLYRLLAPANRSWALLAVLLTALTAQLLEKSRSVCVDQMSSLLCLGCFYLLHSGERLKSALRQYAVFPLFVLAFAIRGPLGLVEICGVACTYWALGVSRSRAETVTLVKKVLVHGIAGLVLLAVCWWLLLKLARIAGGDTFAADVWRMQVARRLDESGQPFYYYFQLSLYRYFPVVPLALATFVALRHKWASRHVDENVQLAIRLGACGLMILVGLSVPHFKRAYYILPMVPMFAAVAAYGLLNAEGWLRQVRRFYEGLVLVLVVLQLLAIWIWRTTRDAITRRLLLLSVVALAAQWLFLVKVLEPAQDRQFDTQGFVGQVEGLRASDPGTLVFVNLGRDTWSVRYMMHLDHDEQPLFIGTDDLASLDTLARPAWVIVARKDRDRGLLKGTSLENAQPAYEGRLNGNPMVVFDLKVK